MSSYPANPKKSSHKEGTHGVSNDWSTRRRSRDACRRGTGCAASTHASNDSTAQLACPKTSYAGIGKASRVYPGFHRLVSGV